RRGWKPWICLWVVASAGMLLAALAVGRARPQIEARAHVHYSRSAAESPGLDPAIARVRAERQVRQTTEFLPRYLGLSAINLLALAALAAAMGSGRIGVTPARAGVLGLVLCDLLSFGFGLNPAISRQEERPASPLIAYLRQELGDSGRALALGAELPPNTLMRYGLADMRNYDSVELASSLAWFAPLYEPGKSKARTSRRPITWLGVLRARDRLQQAGVTAIVSASPPPAGAFERVDRVGGLWVARLPSALLVTTESGRGQVSFERAAGSLRVEMRATSSNDRIVVRETFDPGWRAEVDGRPRAVEPFLGAFLAVPVRAGDRVVKLCYDPPEVRLALGLSLVGLAVALAGVTVGRLNLRKKPVIGLDDFEQSSYNRSCDLHRSSEPVCH
ncbi:MAG TPA: hypothetical protein VGZ22_20340, partial [Isosphaeraceae bacterium]|nr:hypothetical protein [Isosphaeraceae bacterium]